MHQPIQEGLEEFLAGSTRGPRYREIEAHLAACAECRDEVRQLMEQSLLLRALRPPEEVEPSPGFYARVIDRIEAQSRPSFWAEFLEPAFVRRLAYSSVVLLILLGGYMMSTDPAAEIARPSVPEAILASDGIQPEFGADQERDREVVLVNLTSYSE